MCMFCREAGVKGSRHPAGVVLEAAALAAVIPRPQGMTWECAARSLPQSLSEHILVGVLQLAQHCS